MVVHKRETRRDYLSHLRLNPAEIDALYDDLLIGVTSFFRDPELFAALQKTAFPQLLRDHAPYTPLRLWVPGCSSGEEAYSLAIALVEFLGDGAPDVAIQIFGTDLSETAIAQARRAHYPATIVDRVSPERLKRFFVADDGGYRIAKAVRDLCVFSRHNLVRDPPFAHLDLISCRNLLIYLEPELQQRVFQRLHYALDPHGLLVLGIAESPGATSEFFAPVAKRHRIYRRRESASRPTALDVSPSTRTGARVPVGRKSPNGSDADRSAEAVRGAADRAALTHFMPAAVVVDERMQIVQFRGDTSGFLAHAPGAASLDLLRLARAEVKTPLREALQKARTENCPAYEGGITVGSGRSRRLVAVEVIPFKPSPTSAGLFVVSYTDDRTPAASKALSTAKAPTTSAAAGRSLRRSPGSSTWLKELTATKRRLQSMLEEHEATI